MPDIYPNFPYRWMSWDDWLAKVDTMVNARLDATGITNVDGWELWNEPDWTWNTAAAGSVQRRLDTHLPARSGPWTRSPRSSAPAPPLQPHLDASLPDHARNTGTLPDIICWHELGTTPTDIAADVADYRATWSPARHQPAADLHQRVRAAEPGGHPRPDRHYIAKFERAAESAPSGRTGTSPAP